MPNVLQYNQKAREREKKGVKIMDSEKYFIYIGDTDFTVSGTTVAWEAYERAERFGDLVGQRVCLVDGETGEILIDSWSEE